MNSTTSKLTALLGTASLLTMANAITAQAGEQVAQAQEIPETVLITGSLIRGAAAVGVPVTNLQPQDFAQTGALTISDLFRTFPAANVSPGPVATQSGANLERGTRVNIRQLDTGDATRNLLMVDGVRFPGQGHGLCAVDPSIIGALSLERIDILVDGASATYGADAVGGVVNEILRRNFEGAITQVRYTHGRSGKNRYLASALWGRSWDGGNVTLSYEWYDESPSHGYSYGSNFTLDFSPWGLDNRIPLQSSLPGTIVTGGPKSLNTLSATRGSNCANCYAIPPGTGMNWDGGASGLGPTMPFSGSTLNWATFSADPSIMGTNGTQNEFNPYLIAWADAANQRNGGHIAIDQRLTKDVSFFGTAFYSNRRAQFINPSSLSPASRNDLLVQVPTWNPYYPTGGAPSNLRVAYNVGLENPSVTSAYELAGRYQFGLNFALPREWSGQIFMAQTYDSNSAAVHRSVNTSAVSAALGWTIPGSAGGGTIPGIADWTKPGGVPYLNLFCDPYAYQCNNQSTLDYMSGYRYEHEVMQINTKQVSFNGPVYDLPGGQIKLAVGALYETNHFSYDSINNTGSPSLLTPLLNDTQRRNLWAVFSQINIPVFSDMNAIPFFNRLEFEASWRHDQYTDFGGTSNPKIAFNWTPSSDIGLTLRGAWGTSFRAPSFGEVSLLTNTAIACQNFPQFGDCNQQTISTGATGSVPPVGSGAWKVNPTGAASLTRPPGISILGSNAAPNISGLRDPGTLNAGTQILGPEQAMNWAFGGEFAPTTFLQGLDIQATWYRVKITSVISHWGNPSSNSFNDPTIGFAFLVPSDFGCPMSTNASPTDCAAFQSAATALLSVSKSTVSPDLADDVYWINDGGDFNKGWLAVEGIDWNFSYDWDMGNIGAFNVGAVGTYYISRYESTVPGVTSPVEVMFNTDLNRGATNEQFGVESRPRMRYRARFGWARDNWNATLFMDYESHFFHTQNAPPNVNNQCVAAGSTIPGGTFTCAINGYTNIEPSWYSFDLSLGYDTGFEPANEYLRNIAIQLVVQNIMDRKAPFEYRIATGGGNPAAYDILKPNQGRMWSIIVTKTW